MTNLKNLFQKRNDKIGTLILIKENKKNCFTKLDMLPVDWIITREWYYERINERVCGKVERHILKLSIGVAKNSLEK